MGRARITENVGEGLYKVQLLYNLAPLEAELADIAKREAEYTDTLAAANRTLAQLLSARNDAEEAVSAVIQQWRDGLIGPNQSDPPDFPEPPPEAPPGTTAAAQMASELFTAVNAARSAAGVDALTRATELNSAAAAILEWLHNNRATADLAYLPEHRAVNAGYTYDSAVGADSLQSFGHTSNDQAISYWLRGSQSKASLLSDDYSECGTAAYYSSGSAHTYTRCVLLSAPGVVNEIDWPEKDPAKEEAEESDAALDKIEPPKPDSGQPLNVVQVVATYRKAAEAYRLAQKEVERIKAEAQDRDKRRSELDYIKAASEQEVYAWYCIYRDELEVDTIVSTAEVPGWWQNDPISKTTTMGVRNDPGETQANYPVAYSEVSLNIIAPVSEATGQLRPSATLSDAMVFYNAALEPGWLRWQPTWRYGTVTEKVGDLCTVTLLPPTISRSISQGEQNLLLDSSNTGDLPLFDVPSSTCVEVNDEVLIEFEGQDIDSPRILGWRREPLPCNLCGFLLMPHDVTQTWDTAMLNLAARIDPEIKLHSTHAAKPVSWIGRGHNVPALSWDHGLSTRYRIYPDQDCSGRYMVDLDGVGYLSNSGYPGIYRAGDSIATVYIAPDDTVFWLNVVGAAVFAEFVVMISHIDLTHRGGTLQEQGAAHSTTATVMYQVLGGEWQVAGSYAAGHALKAPWVFDRDGKAASTIVDTGIDVQAKIQMTLTRTEANGAVTLTADFFATPLNAVPAFITSSPSVAQSGTEWTGGWQDPGPFTREVVYGWTNTSYQWFSGVSSSGTPADWESTIKANAVALGWPSWFLVYRDYHVVGDADIAAHDAVWSENKYPTYGYTTSYGHWTDNGWMSNQVTMTAWRGYRNTNDKYAGFDFTWDYTYSIAGKRYIAVDYSENNTELMVTIELEAIPESTPEFQEHQSIDAGVWYNRPDFDTLVQSSYEDRLKNITLSGEARWALKINGLTLMSAGGGITGIYVRHKEQHAGERSYSYSPGQFYTERAWIVECDARTESCIYEKVRLDFFPEEPCEAAYTLTEDYDFLDRFLCHSQISTSLTVIVHGNVVDQNQVVSEISENADYRIYGKVQLAQLSPRIHAYSDFYEETHLSATMTDYVDTVFRYWALLTYDPQPRLYIPGQLQSRNNDVIWSTGNFITRQRMTASGDTIQLHDPITVVGAEIDGESYPLLDKLSAAFSVDTPATVIGDDFRLIPISAI